MPTRAHEDAETEAEVLRFFDLFLAQERPLEDAASDDGWEHVRAQPDEDEDGDEEDGDGSASAVSSGSDTSRSASSIATSRSSRSSVGSGRGASVRPSKRPEGGTERAIAPVAAGVAATRRSSSTHYQHRQRQELEYLKRKERELEQTLRRLEREAALASDGSMWQRVAQQQQVASQKAAAENAQLRAMVAKQLKFSQSLERAIRKRPLFSGDTEHEASARDAPSKRRQHLSAETLARSLRARAAHAHQQVERVLAASVVGGVTRDFHGFDLQARPDPAASDSHQLRLEWVNARRLPFRFSAVAREIWRFLSDSSILEQSMPGMTRRVELSGDELLATTDLVFPVGARSAVLHAAAAFCLTVSSGFAHISWVSHGECRAKKSAKDAFQVVEKGWTRIEPLPGAEDACIVRTVNHHMPSVLSAASREDGSDGKEPSDEASDSASAEIGILTELICSAYDKSLGHIYAVIQNALMEQALRGGEAATE